MFLTVYVSAGRKPGEPVCSSRVRCGVVFRRWRPQAKEHPYLVHPHPPARRIAPCPSGAGCPRRLAFYPGRSHGARASAKGQVLSGQLDEEQKGGDGMSRFEQNTCLFSVGSWVGMWQKSREDIPQFLRATLNARSLNFS